MRPVQSLGRAIVYLWQGPPSLPPSLQLEWQFLVVRWLGGFLFITVVLAGYLREQAQRAEMALQERLRQANLLNEATATLGASLEFETVLHTVAAAAGHLFGGRCVVLQPATELDGAVDDAISYVGPDAAPATAAARQLEGQLTTLCGQYAAA